jgi:hypothetical protein
MLTDRAKKEILLAVSLVLAVWGILLFFESAYFAAGFYGVTAPIWTQWVGELPIWWLDAVDTVMVVLLIIAVVLTARHGSSRRRMSRSSGGSALAWVLALFAIFLIVAGLAYSGFTLTGLWTSFKGFFAGLSVLA